jgi:hypothetical protein
LAIAAEFAEHVSELAEQKKRVGRQELKICQQISVTVLQSVSKKEDSVYSVPFPSHFYVADDVERKSRSSSVSSPLFANEE